MTNFEKYKDEILEMTKKGDSPAKKAGKITECYGTRCVDCDFTGDNCRVNLFQWLCTEAAPALTKRERAFCEYAQGGYIARDDSGQLFHTTEQPIKEGYVWGTSDRYEPIEYADFDFITWEDEEPWAVEDLLKLEVEE